MIKYRLRCRRGHEYDSMFNNSGTFDVLKQAGELACEVCGDTRVEKGIMAPAVRTSERKQIAELDAPDYSELPFIGDLGAAVEAANNGDRNAQAALSGGPVLGIISDPDDIGKIEKRGGKVSIVGTARISVDDSETSPEPKATRSSARPAKSNTAKRASKKGPKVN